MFWHIKLQLTYLFSFPFPSIIVSSSRKFPAVILMTFLILQGDRGPQGPPGLPGEDGSRVSCCSHRKIQSESSYNGNKVMINVCWVFFLKLVSFCTKTGRRWGSWTKRSPRWSCKQFFLILLLLQTKSCSDIFPIYWTILNCRYKNYFTCLHIENTVSAWKANKWNVLFRVEIPLTGLELSQGHIQLSMYNFQNHKWYFLANCVKSVTCVLDTSEYSQAAVSSKLLPKYLLIRK